ncbi:MAG: DUF1700 domain-containing protein [Bacilli bacterium]
MNKEQFLKQLKNKLEVLSEEEKNDIINEYRDIIEEKVKHGKKEIDAVSEFGSIDQLTKEILSAYKINPDYRKTNDTENSFLNDIDNLIKKGAKKLSEITEIIVKSFQQNGKELNNETVFVIAIKIIICLFLLVILNIPFNIISRLGSNLINLGFSPLDSLLSIIWSLLVYISYIAICILLIFSIVKKYVNITESDLTKEIIKKSDKKDNKKKVKKTNNIDENNNNEKIQVSKKKEVKKTNSVENIIMLLLKIWVVIIVIIPAWVVIISFIIFLTIAIYFAIKGLQIFGIIILLIGILGLQLFFTNTIYKLLFTKTKIYVWNLIISIIFTVIGTLMTIEYITNFSYHNYLPDKYIEDVVTYTEKISKGTTMNYDTLEIDESLEDYQVRIDVSYYSEFNDIIGVYIDEYAEIDYISIRSSLKSFTIGFDSEIFNDLKNNKVYNYNLLTDYKVKVYVNTFTRDLIE